MSLSPPDRVFMRDMLDWAHRAQRFVADVSQDQFLHDERAQSAVIHALIVIGEAATRVSDASQAELPAIRWHEIRGMRNRLAHDYSGIDIDEVWRSVSIDVPALVTALEAALAR
jgi:uncharacterized protein with HEPN domain